MVISIPASAGEIDIRWAIWTVCIGVCLAIIYSYLDKLISGKIVSQLIILGLGEEKGKTLAELGFSGFFFKNSKLVSNDTFTKTVASLVSNEDYQKKVAELELADHNLNSRCNNLDTEVKGLINNAVIMESG
jgi:hypothetical protein